MEGPKENPRFPLSTMEEVKTQVYRMVDTAMTFS